MLRLNLGLAEGEEKGLIEELRIRGEKKRIWLPLRRNMCMLLGKLKLTLN